MSLAAYASVAWDHALSLLSLYVSHVFPLELKKQRSKKQQKKNKKITADLRLKQARLTS